ncbi:hypothetical protein JCM21714_4147 [Gracilibacillus boraciitolerans JCM 21714]|uniref:DUF4367 domain-containing protein n=1 Tax=Gracilibacillus boraciitolerans JCM 21714 TaxID=1298598 RepID=W4VP63_9BACI|nr:DUF4367 domain-containing protein [Gracilibacillus boraciitolerans]GAE94946.1 hypothetical protein JCM21714_4147 [Gracilibacillus boraciitolerans JCM 21714]
MKDHEKKWQEWLKEDYHTSKKLPFSKEENWNQINDKLSKSNQKKKRLLPKKSLLAVAVFVLIIVGSVFANSNQIQAFDWFVNIFVTSDGEMTQINQTTSEETSSSEQALPDFDKITTEEVQEESRNMTFEEAQAETDFNISQPSFLPGTYRLQHVEVVDRHTESYQVLLHYTDDDGEILKLTETYQPNDFASAKVVDNENTKVKTVALDGGEARLIVFDDASKELIWSTPQMNWLLEGTVTEEHLLEIAESIE